MKLCAIQIPFGTDELQADAAATMAVDLLNQCDRSCDLILTPEYTNAPGAFAQGRCIPFAVKHTPALLEAARNAAVRCNAIVAVNYVCEAEEGLFRNTTEIFDRSGKSAGRFYKQHLPRAEKNVNLLDEELQKKAVRISEIKNTLEIQQELEQKQKNLLVFPKPIQTDLLLFVAKNYD